MRIDHLASFQKAVRYAQTSGEWLILLFPSRNSRAEFFPLLTAACPKGATYSGRSVLTNPGRLTCMVAVETPPDKPFTLLQIAFGKNHLDFGEKDIWLKAAAQRIDLF